MDEETGRAIAVNLTGASGDHHLSSSRSATWGSLVYPLTGAAVPIVLVALIVLATRRIRTRNRHTEAEDRAEEPAPLPARGGSFG